MEVKIFNYSNSLKESWDQFVKNCINSTFLHLRNYMDYHKERFIDHSLIFCSNDGQWLAVLPANRKSNHLISHGGLTYGGLLIQRKLKGKEIIFIFKSLLDYLTKNNFGNFIYKPIPSFYVEGHSDFDQYIMWLLGAEISGASINSVIDTRFKKSFSKSRKDGIRKAKKGNLIVSESKTFHHFWEILSLHLWNKFQIKPTHDLSEIIFLKNQFDENIRLFEVKKNENNELLCGVLLYLTQRAVHVQYISTTEEGRNLGALDLLFDFLINDLFKNYLYFDFGSSNEDNGLLLNQGLLFQKEGFGAYPSLQKTWNLNLGRMNWSNFQRLLN